MPIDGHVDLILRVQPSERISAAEMRSVSNSHALSPESATTGSRIATSLPLPAPRIITGEWILKCEILGAFLDPETHEASAVPAPLSPASQRKMLSAADVTRFWRVVRFGKNPPWDDPKFTIKAFYASLQEEVGHPNKSAC